MSMRLKMDNRMIRPGEWLVEGFVVRRNRQTRKWFIDLGWAAWPSERPGAFQSLEHAMEYIWDTRPDRERYLESIRDTKQDLEFRLGRVLGDARAGEIAIEWLMSRTVVIEMPGAEYPRAGLEGN